MALMTRNAQLVTADSPDLEKLAEGISLVKPRPHHAPLMSYLQQAWPEVEFKHQLTRSGWYRPGGVLSFSGQLLSHDLEAWLNQVQEKVEDFAQLLVDLEVIQPQVTRFNGATHFFTASYGKQPLSCWQLEIEELQEVLDRRLLNEQGPEPEDIADLLEPLQPAALDAQAMGAPFYRLGRLINLRQAVQNATNAPLIERFLEEWQQAPGRTQAFHSHWFFQRHESLTRYGVTQLRMQPHAIKAKQLKTLPWNLHTDALELAAQLRAYDKTAGYNGAWYFGMVAGNLVPRDLAARLLEDWQEGYRYISDLQAALVRGWLHQPYTL
ncbi:hypothetical protein [Marinospirillum sp.]|uniref:hypothetical protein n=1 Tax=Marinospirillum sp. TaxID=2183934 RepID=UPI00384CC457